MVDVTPHNAAHVMRRAARSSSLVGLGALLLAGSGCGAPPPYGEVLLVVDTDLPVPRLVDRLRVDVYTAEGFWFASRDFRLPDPRDWPVSFGIHAPSEEPESEVMVRLRAYPQGRVRPYEGERFRPHTSYREPFVPASIVEMCASPPRLEIGQTTTVRRSFLYFMPVIGGECGQVSSPTPGQPNATGATALRVDIPVAGDYVFGVVDVYPSPPLGDTHTVLELRTDCADPQSWLSCDDGIDAAGGFERPTLTVESLEPGTYHLVTAGNFASQSADITVAAALAADWPVTPPGADAGEPEPVPIHLLDDPARSPAHEPMPETAVDRLLALRIEHGHQRELRTLLRGACMGSMAQIDGGIATGRSCVDDEAVLEPLYLQEGGPPDLTHRIPVAGSFADEGPCSPEASDEQVVCVPGGPSLLGFEEGAAQGPASPTPERLATTPRFWMDRYEVTVGRYRAALAAGFFPEPGFSEPFVDLATPCTWTPEPNGVEDHPLNCINWFGARSFCRFFGGDLPTEAQWEYVAQTAGRELETVYPWGTTPPQCSCDGSDPACHRSALALGMTDFGTPLACAATGMVAQPISVYALGGPNGDVSAGLGVVGLAGNVAEWARDGFYPFDHACWTGSFIVGRACLERESPLRAIRGGDFLGNMWRATGRRGGGAAFGFVSTGFRCVYPSKPGP